MERERRWNVVRRLMERDGLDALVTLPHSGSWDQAGANGRYLTTLGGNCAEVSVVFPRVGDVTAIVGGVPRWDYWLEYQDWVVDVRGVCASGYADDVVARLLELGLEAGRIGLPGMVPNVRVREALVSSASLDAMRDQLPRAEFVDAAFVLAEARFVKGPEELAFLEQAALLCEAAVEVLADAARPGILESSVYAKMVATMLELGAEPTSMLLLTAGNPIVPVVATLPSRRPMEQGEVLTVEIDGKWGGYLSHIAQTVPIGPADGDYLDMAQVQWNAAERCIAALTPGRRLDEFVDLCEEAAAGTGLRCEPILHSRGLGLDLPSLVFQSSSDVIGGWRLEENAVFAVKPRVSTKDGLKCVLWGETVVVSPSGGRRLGRGSPPLLLPLR